MQELSGFSSPAVCLDELVGQSASIKFLKDLILTAAPLTSNVVITGVTGTGKELVADIIHSQSNRSKGPFVKINCAAIPWSLLESELFGVEKGAFTGAYIQRPGKFELAHNGTILLDEIGDMPLGLQAKLVRVVEQKKAYKLGGIKPVSLNVRIIASTNQDLADKVRKKKFREDLYYRLNVVSIHLPPLRERMEDVPLLAQHFLDKINLEMGICLKKVTDEAMGILLSYDWPGNVRELANTLERAAIFRKGSSIGAPEVRMAFQNIYRQPSLAYNRDRQAVVEKNSMSLPEYLKSVERNEIIKALYKTKGVQSEAAKILGLSPKNLWKKIQKYSLESS